MVVEGGDNTAVATAIYVKKTIGCFTNGTTTVPVVDAVSGFTEDISYFRPTSVSIFILATLTSYGATPTSTTAAAVQTALVSYLNELSIGEAVALSALFYEAMSVNASLVAPSFVVQSLLLGTLTAATTGTVTAVTLTITVASAIGIEVGQMVVGAGLPVGTIVTDVVGTTVSINRLATVSGTGVPLQFSTLAAADVVMAHYFDVAQGSAANIAVVVA
jgi:hypothetical protein